MNVTEIIRERVLEYDFREPIYTDDLIFDLKDNKNTAYVAIHRLIEENIINTFEKGIYYRPKHTKFGIQKIDKYKLISQKYIGNNNEKGYVTGPELWNQWGLTTQINKRVWIAQNVGRKKEIDNLNLLIIKAKTEIRKENIKALQFLDLLDQIDMIPDTTKNEIIKKLIVIYKTKLNEYDKIMTIKEATRYPFRVKILLGLIAETADIRNNFFSVLLCDLNKSIKDKKRITFNIDPTIFNYSYNWRNKYETTSSPKGVQRVNRSNRRAFWIESCNY